MEIEYFTGGVDAKAKVQQLRENMYDFTNKERQRYKKIYDVIVTYAKNNTVFLSDINEISGIKSVSKLEDFKYTMYCNNPLQHCNRIVNLIYEEVQNEPFASSLTMNTAVPNEEFTIMYDNRIMLYVYAVQKNKSTLDLYKSIKPKKIDGLNYMPAELEIIDIYHRLYMGDGSIEALTNLEEKLAAEVLQVIGGEVEKIGGDIGQEEKKSTCYERKKDELEAIKIAIVRDFLPGKENIAILGPMAVDWLLLGDKICPKYDRIQIVSDIPVTDIVQQLESYMQVLGKNYKISTSEPKDLMIQRDFRTKRVVFSVAIQTDLGIKEKPFLEYFNSCEFELIPVQIHKDVLVASKHVLCRFLFIDLWMTKFIYGLGKLDKSSYHERQTRLLEIIKNARELDFIADGVIGQYYDYDIHKKEMKKGEEKRFFPYFPHVSMEKYKKLREI